MTTRMSVPAVAVPAAGSRAVAVPVPARRRPVTALARPQSGVGGPA